MKFKYTQNRLFHIKNIRRILTYKKEIGKSVKYV